MKNIRSGSLTSIAVLLLLLSLSNIAVAQHQAPDSIAQITTILPGTTKPQTLTVTVKDGMAILDGDINLGSLAELQSAQDRGVAIDASVAALFRWTDGKIPYTIKPGFTAQYVNLILTAIDYINASTHLLVVPRQSEYNYIEFTPAQVCESAVGRQNTISGPGLQEVKLKDPFATGAANDGCHFPQIVHEIAHAAGLWHEQSREDRNSYVQIHLENVISGKEHNFNQHITDGVDIGSYDFASLMHYAPLDFSKNGQATIVAISNQPFGNATEYSVGDVAAINWMYPINNCPANFTLSKIIPQVARPMVFEVSNTITSTAAIVSGNDITYDAAVRVILSPGFIALPGSTFHAVNEGCGGIYQRASSPEVEEWMASAENNHTEQPPTGQSESGAPIDLNIAPNPFSGHTTITYTLPAAQKVDIQVFSMVGNVVAQPIRQEQQDAGKHEYYFRAEDLPTGVYFLVLQTGGQRQTKRLVLSR